MSRLDIRFSGGARLADTAAGLRQLEQSRPTDILGTLTRSIAAIEQRQFASEGEFGVRDGSVPWAPLRPAYAAWKAVHFPGRPILQRTGDLYSSATHASVVPTSSDSMVIVVADRKASYHQEGTAGRPGRHGQVGGLPPRPPLPVGSIQRIWTAHWARYLKALAEAADHAVPVERHAVAGGDPLLGF